MPSGAQLVTIGMPIVCLKLLFPTWMKIMSTRTSSNWPLVMLWSRVDAVLDQYVLPLHCTAKYFVPLILYASLISWPMHSCHAVC